MAPGPDPPPLEWLDALERAVERIAQGDLDAARGLARIWREGMGRWRRACAHRLSPEAARIAERIAEQGEAYLVLAELLCATAAGSAPDAGRLAEAGRLLQAGTLDAARELQGRLASTRAPAGSAGTGDEAALARAAGAYATELAGVSVEALTRALEHGLGHRHPVRGAYAKLVDELESRCAGGLEPEALAAAQARFARALADAAHRT